MDPSHNVDALLIGTGEFSFSEGAASATDAKAKGFIDFGNILAFTPNITAEMAEHIGSYRGVRRADKSVMTKSGLAYTLKCDEWSPAILQFLFGGDAVTPTTAVQAALTATKGDNITVVAPSGVQRELWYDLMVSGVRKRELTSVVAFAGTPVAATTQDTGDTFTSVAHGLVDGDRVMLVTLVTTTGASTLTPYYVVGKTTDTFQLAETAGGAALVLTTVGTATWLKGLTEGTTVWTDTKLGRIRFASSVTGTAYVFLTGSEITSASATYQHGITPLTAPIKRGYGRLVIYDQYAPNEVALEHVDFSCDVSAESSGEVGSTFAEVSISVKVTDVVGQILIRKANL